MLGLYTYSFELLRNFRTASYCIDKSFSNP